MASLPNGMFMKIDIMFMAGDQVKEAHQGEVPRGPDVDLLEGLRREARGAPRRDVSILKVDGTKVTDTGKRLKLPGQPAPMRGRSR